MGEAERQLQRAIRRYIAELLNVAGVNQLSQVRQELVKPQANLDHELVSTLTQAVVEVFNRRDQDQLKAIRREVAELIAGENEKLNELDVVLY